MIIHLKWQSYLATSIILAGLAFFTIKLPVLGIILGLVFLLLNSLVIGNWLFLKNSWTCKFLFGLLFVLIIGSLVNTTAFYFSTISQNSFYLSLLVVFLASLIIVKKYPVIIDFESFKLKRPNLKISFLAVAYLFLLAVCLFLIIKGQTVESLRSPWEVISSKIFVFYFMASLVLLAIINFAKTSKTMFLVVLHAGLSFGVACLVYQIGFDYDPFIHLANLKLLLNTGTILPKPFYYIGQYSLIIFLRNLLQISPELLNKILTPVLAAVYFPSALYFSLKDNFKIEIKLVILSVFSFLILPYSVFIVSTPQGLANLLGIIAVLLSLYCLNHPKASFWPLFVLGIMILSVHPLTGIPLAFFLLSMFIYSRFKNKINLPKTIRLSIFWEIIILGSIALPIAFWFNSLTLSQLKIGLQNNWLANFFANFSFEPALIHARVYISFIDLVYAFGQNAGLIATALAAMGLGYIWHKGYFKKYFVYAVGWLMVFINFLLVKTLINFNSLVTTEQSTYPSRILEISLYFLIPLMAIGFILLFKKISGFKPAVQLAFLVLLAMFISFSFYLSYPQVDKVFEYHGYSTSATDLKTVQFIDDLQTSPNTKQTKPYIVLANQSVSAGAIGTLGFKYDYRGFYFYPVPTGGRLYKLYYDLAYGNQNTSEIIATARYLTGVNDIYFVLNDYWTNAQGRMQQEKKVADNWYVIDGKNYIFKYEK